MSEPSPGVALAMRGNRSALPGAAIRAKVLSFDAANHQADIAPLETPNSVLGGVPVLEACPADLLATGDTVLAQRFADGQAVVLGPIGAKPAGPVHGQVLESTLRTFTAQSYTAYPGLSLSLTVAVPSYLWVSCAWNGYASAARTAAFAAGLYVGGSQQAPLAIGGCAVANTWAPYNLALRSNAAVAAGAHTLTLKVYVYNAGDTVSCRYAALSALAIPA